MRTLLTITAAAALILSGCGGGETKKEESKAAPPPAAAPAVDEASAATVTGKVSFTGEKPKVANIDMSANPACARAHSGAPAKSEEVVINDNGTLKNVLVYVKSGLPDRQWPTPSTAAVLDQKGCIYTPRVVGVMTGQTLEVINSDQTLHNVHALPRENQEFNHGQRLKGERMQKTFTVPEVMVRFKCDVHPWMFAYATVVDHPYFAVTGADGTFKISGLPAGKYTVEVSHRKAGTTTQEVEITDGGGTANFTLEAK